MKTIFSKWLTIMMTAILALTFVSCGSDSSSGSSDDSGISVPELQGTWATPYDYDRFVINGGSWVNEEYYNGAWHYWDKGIIASFDGTTITFKSTDEIYGDYTFIAKLAPDKKSFSTSWDEDSVDAQYAETYTKKEESDGSNLQSQMSFVWDDYELILYFENNISSASLYKTLSVTWTGGRYVLKVSNVKWNWGTFTKTNDTLTFTPDAEAEEAEGFTADLDESDGELKNFVPTEIKLSNGSKTKSIGSMAWGPSGNWSVEFQYTPDGYYATFGECDVTINVEVKGNFEKGSFDYSYKIVPQSAPYYSMKEDDTGYYLAVGGNAFAAYLLGDNSGYTGGVQILDASFIDKDNLKVEFISSTDLLFSGTYTFKRDSK